MAYARKRRTRVVRRRPTRKYSRRSRARTRPYRKAPVMSKKRLLNTTSRKKRNTMLTVSNTTSTGASTTTGAGSAFVNGTQTGIFLWSPTCMDLTSPNTHVISQEAARTSSTCFMRGLSEHIRLQTSSALPWFHRRICFAIKGNNFFNTLAVSDSPVQPFSPYFTGGSGLQRLLFNENINGQGNTIAGQFSTLFKGVQGTDWQDIILAPVDTTRVDLKFDKTWTLKSGNQSGTVYERKLWHGMNKNLEYDDDESGYQETSSFFSTSSKRGMGDYYVMDFLSPGFGGATGDLVNMNCTSTMYWHEK
uniref:Capsid protein n=1 Tax=Tarsiger cyanurus Genomoviridae sp. TaxID=2814994 RepID=A0A8E7L603_9VIRU|nr:MAG: capsid protein [Gemycircularvirus]